MNLPYGLTVRGILKKEDKFLVVKRVPKSKTNPNKWELPGGKVEKGEDFDLALIREFKEETNLDIKIGNFQIATQDDFPYKRTVVLIMEVKTKTNGFNNIKISEEHDDWKWVNFNQLKNMEISSWFEKIINNGFTI